jgi:predicted AlkP superfamily pyrophosphatase or phosphodiesterase
MKRFLQFAIAGIALCLTLVLIMKPTVATMPLGTPKVILISLDGANASTAEEFLSKGILPSARRGGGLALLKRSGVVALQNVVITPSLTAPSHIAIATGATAARNNITANTFHLVVSQLVRTISGFGAPIGGYTIADPPAPSEQPTAEPLWVKLRAAGKTVATATWPGGDGVDVTVPGLTNSPVIQPASLRTVDYTIPFGAFAGVGAQGFTLTTGDFSPAPETTVMQLAAAGRTSFSPILQKTTALENFTVQGVPYTIQVAALDTTDDQSTNYDTLVFFDTTSGIQPSPFNLPSTGPAYVRVADQLSSKFYLEGSPGKAGTAFYVSHLAPDLSTVRVARYSANFIPRTVSTEVLADIDDVNNTIGFWAPQPDFRIAQRISPGFSTFPDTELEAIYEDQVQTFVDYQTSLGLRAIAKNPNADLVMIYIEQPDGSGHQFTLTDPRQPTTSTNPTSIGSGQDPEKVARYEAYVQYAYQVADRAVRRIIQAVGTTRGVPNRNIIVVSDHGMAPFHTAVNLNNWLASNGFDLTKVRAYTSGPAVNLYINLRGREVDGTVSPDEYVTLQAQLMSALNHLTDDNPFYNKSLRGDRRIFDVIVKRPAPIGFGTNAFIGQDSGDVFAILKTGYNFDGTQNPVVLRQNDPATSAPVLSVPSFYGAHGYDSSLPEMSAIFYAAGPNIRQFPVSVLRRVRNIDVAPTILKILKVKPDETVQGTALDRILR